MDDRFAKLKAATEEAVLRGPGHTPPELRQAVAHGEPPEALRALVAKIRSQPWRVSDDDWAPLRTQYTDDQLFELVVATVQGAADLRLQAALRALEGA